MILQILRGRSDCERSKSQHRRLENTVCKDDLDSPSYIDLLFIAIRWIIAFETIKLALISSIPVLYKDIYCCRRLLKRFLPFII
jgi:hypothetical protein